MTRSALAVALALVAVPVVAQEAPRGSFADAVEVHVLNLEVVVTGGDGAPVAGLGPEDFRVLVDGEAVDVDYFSEIRDRRAVTPAVTVGAGAADPAAAAGPVPAPATVAEGTSYLLFLDEDFALPADRARTLASLTDQLDELRPGDRMAVVTWNGRTLQRLGSWESDPGRVARILEVAATRPAGGGLVRTELAVEDRQVPTLSAASHATAASLVRRISARVQRLYEAATATVQAYAGAPGRKVLLLAAGGFPRDVDVYVAGWGGDDVGRTTELRSVAKLYSPEPHLERLAAAANLVGFTLYPIDMPGRGPMAGDASTRSFAGDTASFERGAAREQQVASPLVELARETGGRAMTDGLRGLALAAVAADVASYYSLGVTRDRARDGSEHRVRVEVLRPGLAARARRGFVDFTHDDEIAMAVEGALLFGEPTGGTFAVAAGRPARQGRRLRLPIEMRIPLDAVVMLPGRNGFEARLELRLAALDDDGDRSPLPSVPVVFGGDRAPHPGEVAVYETTLQLRPEPQRLVVSLYDTVGKTILTAVLDVVPPPT